MCHELLPTCRALATSSFALVSEQFNWLKLNSPKGARTMGAVVEIRKHCHVFLREEMEQYFDFLSSTLDASDSHSFLSSRSSNSSLHHRLTDTAEKDQDRRSTAAAAPAPAIMSPAIVLVPGMASVGSVVFEPLKEQCRTRWAKHLNLFFYVLTEIFANLVWFDALGGFFPNRFFI